MATKAQSEINRIAKAMASTDAPHIGSICMWTLTGCRINRDDLIKLYKKHGLDEAWLPPEIEGSVAFTKALRWAQRGDRQGYMIRPIDDTKEAIIVGIVKEDVDKPKEDLAYGVEAKVKYNKEHESVQVTDSKHPLAGRIKALFTEMQEAYIGRDFTRMLTRNIAKRMGSICLRHTGGVYFVPVHHTETLLKHRAVMSEIGAEFSVLPVYGNDLSKEDLGKQARRALEEEIKEVEAEIQKFKETAPRGDTLKRRLEEFKELKKRAQMYAQLLQIKVVDINQGLGDCEKQIKAILGVVEKEKGEKKGRRRKTEKKDTEAVPKVKNVVKSRKKAPAKKATKKTPAKKAPAKKAPKKKVPAKKKAPAKAKEEVISDTGKVKIVKVKK